MADLMKCFASLMTQALFGLGALSTAALAEPAQDKSALSREMQVAVLQTQDVGKVRELLVRGADIDAPIGCGTFSTLDGAVYTGNVAMLKLLLAHGAKPKGHELADAAFAAGHQQALEMVTTLLHAGVDPNARGQYTIALTNAACRENIEVMRLLLAEPGIKIDESDVDGYTALMWAAKHGSKEITELLIKAGANSAIRNKRGESAADLARQEIATRQSIVANLETSPQSAPP